MEITCAFFYSALSQFLGHILNLFLSSARRDDAHKYSKCLPSPFPALILWKEKKLKTDRKKGWIIDNHLGSDVTSAILLDTSSTRQTTLSPVCTREKVGGGGSSVPLMGRLLLKSSESVITSQTLLRLHIWFCGFGASWLWVLALQNSTT